MARVVLSNVKFGSPSTVVALTEVIIRPAEALLYVVIAADGRFVKFEPSP